MHHIYKITSHPVVDFAAEELKKYLRMMMPRAGEYAISYEPNAKDGIRLGIMRDFDIPADEAKDFELDDILHIDMREDGGIISGSNYRSVLLAVYQYLRENGCRWLFPGIDGEYIPIADVKPVQYHFKPSCRYRAVCNDGARLQRCELDSIDFLPKIGLNTYLVQFDNPYAFYARYYDHEDNASRESESINPDISLQWKRASEIEIGKRGLRLFDMGHGWTSESLGISSIDGWKVDESNEIPEEMRQYVAMINGKRELFHGVAVNTNVCLSNPKARALIVKHVVEYARQAENVYCIKITLADLWKNQCECDECVKKNPSDWYVILLNEIDEALSKEGLPQHLGFSIYADNSWEPKTEKFRHPERFVGNFSPVSRSYLASATVNPKPEKLTPYVRNQSGLFESLDEYIWHAKEWSKFSGGELFVFEYHFWREQFRCPNCIEMAKRLHEDVIAYAANGFAGMMSCASQRNYFPNAFAFNTAARTLYDLQMDFDAYRDDYFTHAYGAAKEIVRTFCDELEKVVPHSFLEIQHSKPIPVERYRDPANIPNLEAAIALCRKLDEDLKPYRTMPYRVQTVAVRLLGYYTEYLRGLFGAFLIKAQGKDDEARECYLHFMEEFGKKEIEIEPYYDQYFANSAYIAVFNSKHKEQQ